MTIEAAGRSLAHDMERVEALVDLGVDSPLKLDLLALIEQAGGHVGEPEDLAALCGVSQREIIPPLDDLVRAQLLEERRFYNVTEYAAASGGAARQRVRDLIAEGPTEIRRLRRALLARAYRSQ